MRLKLTTTLSGAAGFVEMEFKFVAPPTPEDVEFMRAILRIWKGRRADLSLDGFTMKDAGLFASLVDDLDVKR
jgi:hypothetical protein